MLKQIEPKQGANQNIRDATDMKVLTRTEAATQAGLSERQKVTALRVASVPARDYFPAVRRKPARTRYPPTLPDGKFKIILIIMNQIITAKP